MSSHPGSRENPERLASPSLRESVRHGAGTSASEKTGRHGRWLVALALIVTAFNLRTAVTSTGALIDEIQGGLAMSGALAGVLTALPVISFAGFGAAAPAIARRLGQTRTLAASLIVMAAGLVGRAAAPWPWLFLVLSVVSLAGGGIGNVVIPAVVKRHFADHVGAMTAAYTTALAVGQSLAAAVTVPIADAGGADHWRFGLAAWAGAALVGVLPWLPLTREGGGRRRRGGGLGLRPSQLARSRLAWATAGYFAAQSAQAYIVLGWFSQFYQDHGSTAQRAGLLVAVVSALSIPLSLVVPTAMGRIRDHRLVLSSLAVLGAAGYATLLGGGGVEALVWLGTILVGFGLMGFQAVLTLFGLRTSDADAAGALSAFAQSTGYVLAAAGPLLVGILHDTSGGWLEPFILLFAIVAVQLSCGLLIGRPGLIEVE